MSESHLPRPSKEPRDPEFLRVAHDEQDPCPYLPEQTARMPLRLPTELVTPAQMDQLLEAGYRRTGMFFYRTQCPACTACQSTRLEVAKFRPNRSQRRAQKRASNSLEMQISEPSVDDTRVHLFNLHRQQRGLDHGSGDIDAHDYRGFLLNAPCPSMELSFWLNEELKAVAITDISESGLSAVYCYFDPAISYLSPGTFAILQQIELARAMHRRWLYLGYYVAANRHLNYKSRYQPQERLQGSIWSFIDENQNS